MKETVRGMALGRTEKRAGEDARNELRDGVDEAAAEAKEIVGRVSRRLDR